ncbi:hypothetical protein BD779DRAFT_1543442 [Infundibulicybe gibba]|nr:hypothetical protein BD779DRAFT_1543442 [Infundibulicybe gibba]
MRFLILAVPLFLLSTVASAGIINETRHDILKDFANAELATIKSGGSGIENARSQFTNSHSPTNIIVAHGKHRFTNTSGPAGQYHETIWFNATPSPIKFVYAVILFRGSGKFIMEDSGGPHNVSL